MVHDYLYDSAGRLSFDDVVDLGTSGVVDGSVLSIGTIYDDMGRVRVHHQLPQLQRHGHARQPGRRWLRRLGQSRPGVAIPPGAVDTDTTPSVQYTYADGAVSGVAAYLRLTPTSSIPNGRDVQLRLRHIRAVDDIMSRLGSISDSDQHRDAAYSYLGLGTIVREDFQQPQVKLDYDPAGTILHRLGPLRPGRRSALGAVWAKPGDARRIHYAYDRAGNVTSRTNATDAALNDYVYIRRLEPADRVGPGSTPVAAENMVARLAWATILQQRHVQRRQRGDAQRGHFRLRRRRQHDHAPLRRHGHLRRLEPAGGSGQRLAAWSRSTHTTARAAAFRFSSDFTGSTPGTVDDDY